ncbi:MAG: hypothetical protein WC934_06360 [Acidithiobacillus sp.]|jgi:hypothetical protein|uniref:hypothetical protein n=1 Tax=Acidithiobacillus sp. TaxID=1872118 RepID=UPI00355F438C
MKIKEIDLKKSKVLIEFTIENILDICHINDVCESADNELKDDDVNFNKYKLFFFNLHEKMQIKDKDRK